MDIKKNIRIKKPFIGTGLIYDQLPIKICDPSCSESKEQSVNPKAKAPQDIHTFLVATAKAAGSNEKRQLSTQPYYLHKRKAKVISKKSNLRKSQFSSAEKRQLGLHLLPRNGLKFESFVPLHSMWREYMMNFMNIEQLKANGFKATPQDKHWDEFSLQLIKADYHGAFMEVTRSKCASLVGISGIVVMDTKNTYKLVGRDDVIRSIPKDTSVFTLTLDEFKLTIFGKHLCIRPAERTVKKIKTRMCADL